jgi:hypothetical protein
LDGFVITDAASLDSTEQGKEFVELHLGHAHVVEEILGEGRGVIGDLHHQARTVLGSTANTRATARIPNPSASAPTAHTSLSGATRLPCNGVPCVSRKYPRHWLQ